MVIVVERSPTRLASIIGNIDGLCSSELHVDSLYSSIQCFTGGEKVRERERERVCVCEESKSVGKGRVCERG